MSEALAKILHIGDAAISSLYDGPVEITEKVDGSQIGWWLDDEGELHVRSKGRELPDLDNADKLFAPAVAHLKTVKNLMQPGVTHYGETLCGPKHSTLKYTSVPKGHIALFGAMHADRTWEPYVGLVMYAMYLDIDVAPLVYFGHSSPEHTLSLLDHDSFLGGQKIEGVVVKRQVSWEYFGHPLHIMCGKYVSEQFKETHKGTWKYDNTPAGGIEKLKIAYASEARWTKAVQHLRDNGELELSPRDIGKLIVEAKRDIEEEEREAIKDALWKLFGPDILRRSTSGLPEWYKQSLALGTFDVAQVAA